MKEFFLVTGPGNAIELPVATLSSKSRFHGIRNSRELFSIPLKKARNYFKALYITGAKTFAHSAYWLPEGCKPSPAILELSPASLRLMAVTST